MPGKLDRKGLSGRTLSGLAYKSVDEMTGGDNPVGPEMGRPTNCQYHDRRRQSGRTQDGPAYEIVSMFTGRNKPVGPMMGWPTNLMELLTRRGSRQDPIVGDL